MKAKSIKIISISGIALVLIYLAAVLSFLITHTGVTLTLWEICTMISAPFILIFLETVLVDCPHNKKIFKELALVAMSGSIVLTNTAHFINLTVTRVLVDKGFDVPLYYQIGQWPSVEMALDYLAWGLFLGLALIFTAISIPKGKFSAFKGMSFASGIMCLIGFMGPVIGITELWYISVMGYTVGFIILCVINLCKLKNSK